MSRQNMIDVLSRHIPFFSMSLVVASATFSAMVTVTQSNHTLNVKCKPTAICCIPT